ncbi:O-antigen ligase family protein [Clostridium saudiense]|nr:O-antigen ligase family protein [Clostridium saudiense]
MKKTIKIYPIREIRTLFYAFIFFALLKPDSLEYIGLKWLDQALILLDGIIMAILLLFAITRRYRISIMTIIIICMYGTLALSTAIISKDYFTLLKTAGPAIAICMFTDYALQKKPQVYFRSIIFLLGSLYLLNFITILMYYPEGMYQMELVVGDLYLMGYDNGMIYNLLPLCCYSFIYSYVKHNKLFTKVSIFSVLLMLISVSYVKSASGIIQAIFLIVLVICTSNKIIRSIIKPKILFLGFIVITLLVVVFRIQNNFSWLFVDILGKDLTFTGRTYLWDYTLPVIRNNWLFGIGAGGRTVLGVNGHTYPHPHCLILDMLYKGGILMFGFFMSLLSEFSKKYKKEKNYKIKNILLVTITVFLIGEVANSVQYKIFFWAIFVTIEYCGNIQKMFESK